MCSKANTLKVLDDAFVDGDSCLPPHSLTYMNMLRVKLNMTDSSCDELMNASALIKDGFADDLVTCTEEYIHNFDKPFFLSHGDRKNILFAELG